MTVYYLPEDRIAFPDPDEAEPDGLLALGGDLAPRRLIAAYARGIFPWYNEDTPILWWTPDPRLVLFPDDLHVPRSLRRVLNSGCFEIRTDTCFERVVRCCAQTPRPQGPGTWILEEVVKAYAELHRMGVAHSMEAWQDGQLVGGLYGVALGRVFFGESMFFRESNASKAVFVTLVRYLETRGYHMIDCQQTTLHMQRFGAREISRREFNRRLRIALEEPTDVGRWDMPEGFHPLR